MKYSLVIVAYKAEEQLLRCLASLEHNPPKDSDREAEIVIVDNSPRPVDVPNAVLHALLVKYVRVRFIWDGTNRGFAEGCNEGARQSHGKLLVFINPDTQVFPGWAEGLAGYLEGGVGAVGPISNFVAGFQRHDVHMQAAATWEETAALAKIVLAGRGVDTKLLIGFFLMIPRKVWDAVGGVDPQFFLGCDDLDLSLRIRENGYSLVIASDVFVYHEGHASFREVGEEAVVLNKQAEKKLLKKLAAQYPDGIPTSTELWGCEILPTDTGGPMTLSVCMIVRDEEDNLRALLPQLGFADEIVLVDTALEGEEWDRPVPLEMEHKVQHFQFPWVDDYSAARNFALSKCTKDWVLWLDADDRVPELSGKLIRAALDNPGPLTLRKACHFALRLRDHLPTGRFAYTDQPRIFPRLPGLEWEGKVHETYQRHADRLGLQLVTTAILIDHWGYSDAALLQKKHARNLALLREELDSPSKFMQMGKSLIGRRAFIMGRLWLEGCLTRLWEAPLAPEFIAQCRYLIALSYYQEREMAVPEMDEWLLDNPKPDALFLRAERAFVEQDLDLAAALYRAYAGMGDFMDYYGTDRDSFAPAIAIRLDMIKRLREEVHA